MSYILSSRERIQRMFEHREADRVPILDYAWSSTVERWRREGLPETADYRDILGLDKTSMICLDVSPRFPEEVLEETEEYRVFRNGWGTTVKDFKHSATVPEYIDFRVKDRASWLIAKARMMPADDRIPWAQLERDYPVWRREGHWITCGLWFGMQAVTGFALGPAEFLMLLVEDPDFCHDMLDRLITLNLDLAERVWDRGYTFDSILWAEDLGFKLKSFISPAMYREFFQPAHRRAVEWAHARGAKAYLHSCGCIRDLLPDIVSTGVDALNPLEVKSGMDPLEVKRLYGDRLVLHGGIDALLCSAPAAMEAEIRRIVPEMKRGGGYIFGTDHSIPDSISFTDIRHIMAVAHDVGRYD